MVLCLGEPPRRLLWCWLSYLILISFLYLHFIFDLHFVVVLHLSFFFIHIFFSASSLTLLWTIAVFLHPFYTFIPAHRRVSRDTFIFNHSVIFLPRALRFWVGVFYPQEFFTSRSFTNILPAFIKANLGACSSSLKFSGLHTNPRNTDPAHLFDWFTVIHNLHIQNDSFLNSTKYFMNCLWWKFNLSAPYSFRTLVVCSKSYVRTI